jgi:hypothetical protein
MAFTLLCAQELEDEHRAGGHTDPDTGLGWVYQAGCPLCEKLRRSSETRAADVLGLLFKLAATGLGMLATIDVFWIIHAVYGGGGLVLGLILIPFTATLGPFWLAWHGAFEPLAILGVAALVCAVGCWLSPE